MNKKERIGVRVRRMDGERERHKVSGKDRSGERERQKERECVR